MELLRNKRPNIFGAPTIIQNGIKMRGHVQCLVRRADCPDINELVFEDENLIENAFKNLVNNAMVAAEDYALDNLRATQDATGTSADDGILIFNNDTHGPAGFVGIMANTFEATTNYSKRWQGIWQEPSATEDIKSAEIGHDFDGVGNMDVPYATEDISPDIALVLNDILTINWTITITGA